MSNAEKFNNALLSEAIIDPAIVTYNRIEPRPRAGKFERSLRAEVRDAMWMLARQWQVGELRGEDAARATQVRVSMETAELTRVARRNGVAEAYDASIPLEAFVEAEPAPVDLRLRLEMGHYWLRLLRQFNVSHGIDSIFRGAYPVTMPPFPTPPNADAPQAALFADHETWQWYAAAQGRAVDGALFYSDLLSGRRAADVVHDGAAIPALEAPHVDEAQAAFMIWAASVFFDPPGSAWSPSNLEYQFACSAPRPNAEGKQDVLLADEYPGGSLDWYSFDRSADAAARLDEPEGVIVDDDVVKTETFTMLPAPVTFAGMPNPRWWEFEDSRTDFGAIRPGKTDIAKLLLVEFGLLFGNDWLMVPYRVSVASICRVQSLIIEDTFGQRTLIRPAAQTGKDWQLFTISVRGRPGEVDARLFIPPAAPILQESKPIESVVFTRDEMSNVVWAIESVVPNDRGGGMDGYEAALEVRRLLEAIGAGTNPVPPAPPVETDALILYRLATGVPENWIPFVPVRRSPPSSEVDLRRARIPRLLAGLNPTSVRPRGEVLRPVPLPAAYYVFEHEVPRGGAMVKRTYQRVRWYDGNTYVWLGRRKQMGRGESSSGLRFDQIEDSPTPGA
jgi:hypothetical protein